MANGRHNFAHDELFAGPGEARARARSIDWSATPLGPVEAWSPSLSVATRLCLDANTPMALWAGPELTLIHNDAYLEMLGSSFPSGFARPLREGAPQRIELLGAACRQIMAGGSATREEGVLRQLRGRARDDAARVSYALSPIRDAAGRVLAVLELIEEIHTEPPARPRPAPPRPRGELDAGRPFLLELSDAFRSLSDPVEIQATASRLVGEHLGVARVNYYMYDEDAKQGVVHRGYVRAGEASIAGVYRFDDFPTVHERLRHGTLVISDTASSARLSEGERAAFSELGVAAYVVAGLVKGGHLRGALAITESSAREWSSGEVALLEDVAERTWEAVERARAEAALRESGERYRRLFETMKEGFAVIELVRDSSGRAVDLRYLELSTRFETLTGLRRESLIGRLRSETLLGADEERLATYRRVVEEHEPTRFERHVPALGRWYDVAVFPWAGDQFALVFDDISARRRDEQARRQSEAHKAFLLELSDALRPLLEPAEIELAASRVLGQHLEANRVLYAEIVDEQKVVIERDWVDGLPSVAGRYPVASYGLELAEILRRGETLVVDDISIDTRLSKASRRAFDAGGVVSSIATSLIKNGRWIAVFGVHCVTPRVWAESEIALLEETAERTWAAIERARAEAALRESRRRLATILEQLPVAVGVFDAQGNAVLSNDLMKVFAPEMLPAHDPEQRRRWRIVDTEGRTLPAREWPGARALRGESVRAGLELMVSSAEGKQLCALISAVPLSSREGEIGGAILVVQDITARKLAEEQLRESDRRKDEFLAMLGHELRNPLAALRSATEVMALASPTDPRLQRAHGVLERQTSHMSRLVDGLLEVSRVARGKVELELETFDLRGVTEEVIEDRASELEARGLELRRELSPEPVWVRADRVRLTQIIDNLVGNAIKFTPARGRIVLVTGVSEGAGQSAVLRVCDTGVGIRPEMLERLFEPFQQEVQDIARAAGGLGLGLALARGLVDLHGGEIEARSAGPGAGAEFEVRLPLGAAPTGPLDEPSLERARGCSVLLVEDNADAAEMLRCLLEVAGHEVRVAPTGAEALEALRLRGADVVLCDLGLPGMSGYELARALRLDPRLRDTPLVALTGYGQPEDRRQSAQAGFDEHLTKPVDLDVLQHLLNRLGRC